ncbi:sugar ABC transporter ATP-binding protein [Leucobacter weissii]|uniref:Sugar ABC transporter ATP-binding protein n=1 Tax=Leucobacter weissii TaxID=1983706 RepID=A0A939MNJ5_9MICO|nr:sugar ABC transporter ATP-binding protein [Leucobacter weissii]MBO1903105.1 sugar ABC transporter ATP-binding protein [Leucobacter weissii]
MTNHPHSELIVLEDIGKEFGGLSVLADVSLTLVPGEIVGLVGENGAGKSTLLNILSGVFPPSHGRIRVGGRLVDIPNYRAANELGLFRVYQDVALVESRTVEENLLLGWERRLGRLGVIDQRRRREYSVRALARLGLPESLSGRLVSDLSISVKQTLSFAKVLATIDLLEVEHPVIFLDEPTTSLDKHGEATFLRVVRELAETQSASIVFVSHLLEEILDITSRVLVLKDGRLVAEEQTSGLTEDDLHRLMVGRVRSDRYYREDLQSAYPGTPGAEPVRSGATVSGLRIDPGAPEVEFSVAPGEVLGLAGLEGSGKNEIGSILAGVVKSRHRLSLDEKTVRYDSVRTAVESGIVYLPQDRASAGVFPEKDLEFNLIIGSVHDRYSRPSGILRGRLAKQSSRRLLGDFGVRAVGIEQPISELSGGNQQKVLIARWLHREPRLVILDSPTQGVDTGSRESIYEAVRAAAGRGAAVILISDDLSELIGLSDRLLVIKNRGVVADIRTPPQAKPQEDEVVAHMF